MKDSKHKRYVRALARILFVLYLIITVYVMFFSENLGRDIKSDNLRYNLVLFDEIKRFWYSRHTLGMKIVFLNIAGNVIAFMPFGFILPMLTIKKVYKNIVTVTLLTLLFSCVIETMQLYLKIGAFDIDDLFLNTLGGFCGCLIYHLFNTIRVVRQRKNNKH